MMSYYLLNPNKVDELYKQYAWSNHSFNLIAIPYGVHRVRIHSVLVETSKNNNKYLRVNVINDIDYIEDGEQREYIFPKMYFMENRPADSPFNLTGLKRFASIFGIDSSPFEDLYDYQHAILNAPPTDFLILCEHQMALSVDTSGRPKKNKQGKFIINRQPVTVNFSSLNDDMLFHIMPSEPMVKDLSYKEKLLIKNYK